MKYVKKVIYDLFLIDINECCEEIVNCLKNVICNDIDGVYICICNKGFNGDGKICISIVD